MHRLGRGSFDEEIIELKELQIFEHQKSNSLRDKQMQNRRVAFEEELEAGTERMISLEVQQNDPKPKNIKGKYCSNILI